MVTSVQGHGKLARQMRVFDYFTLGFGAMVGVGWVALMGDWISLGGGPVPTFLAFLLGTLIMIPIGFAYAELTPAMPVAGGELAYAYKAYGTFASFLTGWFLSLAYIIVCPWEAIAINKVLGYLIPGLNVIPLYSVMGYPIYLPQVILGVALSLVIIGINYVGIKQAAKFQTWLTLVLLAAAVIVVVAGFFSGSPGNLTPIFEKPNVKYGMFGGILAVLSMAPFFLAGFDTIPQGAEEAESKISYRDLGKAIVGAILAGGGFYVLVILAAGWTMPWQQLVKLNFPTAEMFKVALGSPVLAVIALAGAVAGLISTFNGLFIASTRLLYAMGRGRLLPEYFATVHPKYQTPTGAVIFTGFLTLIGPFIGKKFLIPLADVGSVGFVAGWLSVSLAAARLRSSHPEMHRPYRMPGGKLMAYLGVVVCLFLLYVMLVPGNPGSLVWPTEYAVLIGWVILGAILYAVSTGARKSVSEEERTRYILSTDRNVGA